MKEEIFNDEMAASKERELHSEAKIHTKRFSALRLGMGALFPVLSTFLNPDFITAYVFTVLALPGPNLYSYKTTQVNFLIFKYLISYKTTKEERFHTSSCCVSPNGLEPPRF